MNETDLERIAARLGDRAAARLDVERTAAAVLHRLRTERPASLWQRSSSTLLRMAAAVALILGAGWVGYRMMEKAPVEAPLAPVVASLQTLSSDEMQDVLDSLAIESPAYQNIAVGLHDLSTEQLTELLRRMEG